MVVHVTAAKFKPLLLVQCCEHFQYHDSEWPLPAACIILFFVLEHVPMNLTRRCEQRTNERVQCAGVQIVLRYAKSMLLLFRTPDLETAEGLRSDVKEWWRLLRVPRTPSYFCHLIKANLLLGPSVTLTHGCCVCENTQILSRHVRT
jgi:hypothetical protein